MNNNVVTETTSRMSSLAISTMIFGAISLVLPTTGILYCVPAIICGHMAKRAIKDQPEKYYGEGLAKTGLTLGYVGLVISLLVLWPLADRKIVSYLEGNHSGTTNLEAKENIRPNQEGQSTP